MITKRISNFTVYLMITWLIIGAVFAFSTVEGKLLPVTSMLKITDITPAEDGEGSYVAGTFTKERNCVFKGLTWYYVPSGIRDNSKVAYVAVYSQFRDKPQVRESGEQEFFKLYVRLDEEDILNHSHVEVLHDCYNGYFWTTITHFLHNVN